MFEQTENENSITTSFKNVQTFYEQISKLILEMDQQFANNGFQPNLNNPNAICRWRSDRVSEFGGWLVDGIGRPYYFVEDGEQNHKQIVINIVFHNEMAPVISYGLFTYDGNVVDKKFGIGEHWLLYWPFMLGRDWNLKKENKYLICSNPTTDKSSINFRGLRENLFATLRLLNICNSESLQELVINPSIELFQNNNINIDDTKSNNHISCKDYLEIFPYR
ncbi:MAG: hypothetical protein ACOCQD_04950 [archaeon]